MWKRCRPVAEEAAEKGLVSGEKHEKRSAGAQAGIDSAGAMRGLRPPPPSDGSFSAATKTPLYSGLVLRYELPKCRSFDSLRFATVAQDDRFVWI